jgi:hypothetical protein
VAISAAAPKTTRMPSSRLPTPDELKKYQAKLDAAAAVQKESQEKCPHCGGPMFAETLKEQKKDACYHKVKSRYKVWPSAYASGALVQCRKKGAANWGSKS